ncbi:hypothetical protein L3X38_040498 [Prunus dulcis]|uniref:Uncharacterized protein n=1 Tax=Prunus dulcis TaxID=3755 RepID=A0AAD4V959_PRUDU|nr:hypothetical protein L3X38_040498 [Prunus dulcis]
MGSGTGVGMESGNGDDIVITGSYPTPNSSAALRSVPHHNLHHHQGPLISTDKHNVREGASIFRDQSAILITWPEK